MIDEPITHHVQKYIISVLYHQKVARFRDLRKPNVDTNLFSYHLKLLLKQGYVEKVDGGYSLKSKGLAYVDRISEKDMNIRTQPKVVTMLVVEGKRGDVLLWRRDKQPYIDTWTLPYGKVHIDDASIAAAASREAHEKLGLTTPKARHVGDCYIRVCHDDSLLSATLVHVFHLKGSTVKRDDRTQWLDPHELAKTQLELAPAVPYIVKKTLAAEHYFFDEFTVDW